MACIGVMTGDFFLIQCRSQTIEDYIPVKSIEEDSVHLKRWKPATEEAILWALMEVSQFSVKLVKGGHLIPLNLITDQLRRFWG